MKFKFTSGYSQSEVNKTAIRVKYIIKGGRINSSSILSAVSIDLIDSNNNTNHWLCWLLVPVHHSYSHYFILYLERLMNTVLITDSVLYLLGDFELMKFKNKVEDNNLSEQDGKP